MQFIYDPHLAPYIEALLAAHRQSVRSTPVRHRHADSVPVPSVGVSSARREHHTKLRRRTSRQVGAEHELLDNQRSYESEGGVRRRPIDDGKLEKKGGSEDGRMRSPVGDENVWRRRDIEEDADEMWGRPSAYDLKDSVLLITDTPERSRSYSHPSPSRRISDSVQPLIDLDPIPHPTTTPEEEIRSVIFNYAPTPATHQSGSATPAHPTSANPFLTSATITPDIHVNPSAAPVNLTIPGRVENLDDSMSMSSLSFSKTFSPPPAQAGLGGMSADQWASLSMSSSRREEDDLISLPETSTSGYEDAETYSPVSRALSPVRIHSAFSPPHNPVLPSHIASEGDGLVDELGLSYAIPLSGVQRGPMSVVSLSESEGEEIGDGWRSESEGEGVGR